jgi:hypothetical protein
MKRFWIINFLLFQTSWFCAAFYTEHASLMMLALLGLHFCFSPTRLADIKVLLLVGVGLVVDNLHLTLGTFSAQAALFPVWLALLWCVFVISLNHSLQWLINKPLWLIALLGGVGGTSSYMGGVKAGALQSSLPTEWLVAVLFVAWGLLFPMLVLLYRYLQPLAQSAVVNVDSQSQHAGSAVATAPKQLTR